MEQGTGIDLHFRLWRKLLSGSVQPSPAARNRAAFRWVRFPSCYKNKEVPNGTSLFLEQGTGVEPAFTAWEAVVLPIYEPCRVRVLYQTAM